MSNKSSYGFSPTVLKILSRRISVTVSLCLPIFILQWLSLPIFVVYRLIVTAYNLAWLIYDIHCHGRKLFIYLTYWTYTILNMYLICATTLSCIALHRALWKQKETASGPDKRSVAIEMGPLDDNYSTIDHESEASEKDALPSHHKIFWVFYVISATGGHHGVLDRVCQGSHH